MSTAAETIRAHGSARPSSTTGRSGKLPMAPDLQLVADPTPLPAPITEFAAAMSALASSVVLVTCWSATGRGG